MNHAITSSSANRVGLFAVMIGFMLISHQNLVAQGQPSEVPNPVNVKVTNTTDQPVPVIGVVNVSNLGSSPLPIKDMDNPARQPFQMGDTCITGGSITTGLPRGHVCEVSFAVPEGKRLVIEYVSMDARDLANGSVGKLTVSTEVNGRFVSHYFSHTQPAVTFGAQFPISSASLGQQVRLYADPGTSVSGFVTRPGSFSDNPVTFFVSISGYLVNVP